MAAGALAGGLAAAEVCAPLLLLCWLCCWPDDASSDTSSNGKHPKTPVVKYHRGRRSSELVPRRGGGGGSAADLHRPSTSGHSGPAPAAHRSHEELPRRCQLLAAQGDQGDAGRYHSAPSVIDEVLHRRVWERSSRELQPERDSYIAELQPDRDGYITVPLRPVSTETLSPEDICNPPRALPESSSIEDAADSTPSCKKHHTNTKNGKGTSAKELARDDESKEEDVTEAKSFYIGDEEGGRGGEGKSPGEEVGKKIRKGEEAKRALYKAKDAKQSFNESVRSNKTLVRVEEHREARGFGPGGSSPRGSGPGEDRSGAVRHCEQSRSSLNSCASRTTVRSVEPVGYDGAACYLSERQCAGADGGGAGWGRRGGRHASDGDILTPAGRPESGAFSESELELDLALLAESEELPPPYSDVDSYRCGKETAI